MFSISKACNLAFSFLDKDYVEQEQVEEVLKWFITMSYKAIFLNTTFVVVDGYGYLAMCLWNSLQINGLFSLLWSAYLTIVLHKVGLQKKYFVCCRCYDLFIQLMEGYFVLRGTQTICRRKCQSWKSKTSKASSCTESSIATRITIYDGSRE